MEYYQEQLRYQIESSPFSETFELISETGEVSLIRGIFDVSLKTDEDRKAPAKVFRLLVYEVPEYSREKTSIRIHGRIYKITRHETNIPVGSILWLNG